MARGMTTRGKLPFVLEEERAADFPAEDKTTFQIRHLNGVEMIECQSAARRDPAPVSMAYNLALAAARIALEGWDTYPDGDGKPQPFPGSGLRAVKLMDPRHILEVGTEIARMSMPTGTDLGKSDSGSSGNAEDSGNSASRATKTDPEPRDASEASG